MKPYKSAILPVDTASNTNQSLKTSKKKRRILPTKMKFMKAAATATILRMEN
jgi:hypothetical protein